MELIYDEMTDSLRRQMEEYQRKTSKKAICLFTVCGGGISSATWFLTRKSIPGWFVLAVLLTAAISSYILFSVETRKRTVQLQKGSEHLRTLEIHLSPDELFISDRKTGRQKSYPKEAWKTLRETADHFELEGIVVLKKRYLVNGDTGKLRAWFRENWTKEQYLEADDSGEALILTPLDSQKGKEEEIRKLYREWVSTVPFGTETKKEKLRFRGVKISIPVKNTLFFLFQTCFLLLLCGGQGKWCLVWCVLFLLMWLSQYARVLTELAVKILFYRKLRGKKQRVERVELNREGIRFFLDQKTEQYAYEQIRQIQEGEHFLQVIPGGLFQRSALEKREYQKMRERLKEACPGRYRVCGYIPQDHFWEKVFCLFSLLLFLMAAILQGQRNPASAGKQSSQINNYEIEKRASEEKEAQRIHETQLSQVGDTVVQDGIFIEKVRDVGALSLGSEETALSECYVASAANESTYLRSEGMTVYGGSYNQYGQLGQGDQEEHLNAKGLCREYEIATDVLTVSVGRTFLAYLKSDGTLYVSGTIRGKGELLTPTAVLSDVAFFDSGEDFILALKKDGSVWILGDVGKEDREVPEGISVVESYPEFTQIYEHARYVTAGRYTLAVITEKNELYLWGDNSHGQCGGKEGQAEFIRTKEAVRVPGEVKMVWLDLPEKDTSYTNVADPSLTPYIILTNYRTYIQKKDLSLAVCGEGVEEGNYMPLQFVE